MLQNTVLFNTKGQDTSNSLPIYFFFPFPAAKPEFFSSLKMGQYLQLMCHHTEEAIYHQVKLLCKCLLTSIAIIFCGAEC